jgi:hypothetical protein
MAREPDKKELELHLFEEFKKVTPTLHLELIEHRDCPDILARTGDHRVGIEITRYYRRDEKTRGSQEKLREREEDAVIEMARCRYEASGNPTVRVSVFWGTHEPRRANRVALAHSLADVICQHVPQLGHRVRLQWGTLPSPLDLALHCVSIDRLINYKHNYWNAVRAAFVLGVEPTDIQRIIDDKERRIDRYRDNCDEIWLLIASEGRDPSSWCDVTDDLRITPYTARFNRAFFLSDLPRQAIELRLIP